MWSLIIHFGNYINMSPLQNHYAMTHMTTVRCHVIPIDWTTCWQNMCCKVLRPNIVVWPGVRFVTWHCAIYPRMYKLLIRADFDGKGLNENTADYKIPTFSTRLRISETFITCSNFWRSLVLFRQIQFLLHTGLIPESNLWNMNQGLTGRPWRG
jgi:hypothetical protein